MKKLFILAAVFVFGISAFGQKTKSDEKPLAPTFSSTTIDGKAINIA